jgi:hypothetical protein
MIEKGARMMRRLGVLAQLWVEESRNRVARSRAGRHACKVTP